MKLKIGFFFCWMMFFIPSFAQEMADVKRVKIQSKALNQEREILVYTPKDYDYRTHEYFNVIYVFDSHERSFFDYTSAIISFLTDDNQAFIVVGITSPYNEKLDYSRRNDFLPDIKSEAYKKQCGPYYGNADNFLNFIESELMAYINTNYRTLNQNMAVGHSLGASFILYALLERSSLFQNYIAISPNLAYDEEMLSKRLASFDYSQIKSPTFIYLSHANEGIDYWKEWKPARESLYAFYKDALKAPNALVEIAEFPNNNHWNTFPPSLNHALAFYFNQVQGKQANILSPETYEVTIKIKVAQKEDVVYITGNQASLGDWNPGKIKMKAISDLERSITLKLQSPAQFKFTQGDWASELPVDGTYNQVIIKPETKKLFEFKVAE